MKTLLSNLWKLLLLRLVVKAGLVPELRERLIASELQIARLQWKLQHLRDWAWRSMPRIDAKTMPAVTVAHLREELVWLDAL